MKIKPKVRYGYEPACGTYPQIFKVYARDNPTYSTLCECESRSAAKRICAAMNHHEAVRRGEIASAAVAASESERCGEQRAKQMRDERDAEIAALRDAVLDCYATFDLDGTMWSNSEAVRRALEWKP